MEPLNLDDCLHVRLDSLDTISQWLGYACVCRHRVCRFAGNKATVLYALLMAGFELRIVSRCFRYIGNTFRTGIDRQIKKPPLLPEAFRIYCVYSASSSDSGKQTSYGSMMQLVEFIPAIRCFLREAPSALSSMSSMFRSAHLVFLRKCFFTEGV